MLFWTFSGLKYSKVSRWWKCLLKHSAYFCYISQNILWSLYDRLCRIICYRPTAFLGMVWVPSSRSAPRKASVILNSKGLLKISCFIMKPCQILEIFALYHGVLLLGWIWYDYYVRTMQIWISISALIFRNMVSLLFFVANDK